MREKEFVHLHSSSRFDRSVESLTNAVRKYNKDADIVTYTEVEAKKRENVVRSVGKEMGFRTVAGSESYSNDCAISFKTDRFALLHDEQFKATNKTFFNTNGKERTPAYATIAVLRDVVVDKKVVVAVVHMPASVEGDIASKNVTRRTVSWYSTFRGTKKRANKLAKTFKADTVLFVADFNIDFKRAWVRSLVKYMAPSYNSTWKVISIVGGTHHKRLIDTTLIKGKNMKVKGSARLYPDDNSSDHRPYFETLVWK